MASNDLHKLIKSLTPSEKRYIKLTAGFEKGNPAYLKLLDAVDRQPTYDEAKLVKKFSKLKEFKQFAAAKLHLTRQVMRCLRSFHDDLTVDIKLSAMLTDIRFLYARGLYSQAQKITIRGRDKCAEFGKLKWIQAFVNWELKLIDKFKPLHLSFEEKAELLNLERNNIKRLKLLCRISQINNELFAWMTARGKTRNVKIKKLLDKTARKPLNKIYNATEDAYIKYATANGLAHYFKIINDLEGNFKYTRQLKELGENHPEVYGKDINRAIAVHSNYLVALLDAGRYSDFQKELESFRNLPQTFNASKTSTRTTDAFLRCMAATHELRYYNEVADFNDGPVLAQRIEKEVDELESLVRPMRIMLLCFRLSYFYFLSKDFERAFHWIEKRLAYSKHDPSNTHNRNAQLLFLLICFQLKRYHRMKETTKELEKWIANNEKSLRTEHLTISLLKKWRARIGTHVPPDLFSVYRHKLVRLKAQSFEKSAFDYIDLLRWADMNI